MPQDNSYSEEFKAFAKEMATHGRVPVYGPFNDEMQGLVIELIYIASKSLTSQGKAWCTLQIDSSGGAVSNLDGIRVAMNESNLKFRGLVENRAHSCGFNLLQSCNWRVGTTGSTYMFHYGSMSFKLDNHSLSRYKKDKFTYIDSLINSQSEEIEELSKRSRASIKKLLKLADRDIPITVGEALKLGFLDEFVSFYPKSEKPPEGYVF